MTIWVKAFIPIAHQTNADYTRPIPNRVMQTMIPAPQGDDVCFATNHRWFALDPNADAKLSTALVLVIPRNGGEMRLEALGGGPASGKNIHSPGTSTKVDASSGKVLASRPGSLEASALGAPSIAGDKIQFIFQASASNPFAPSVAPSIDYSFDMTFDRATGLLSFSGTIGRFPAFEAYAMWNDRRPVALVREAPSSDTAWGLYDLGTGVGDRRVTGSKDVRSSKHPAPKPEASASDYVEYHGLVRPEERNFTARKRLYRDHVDQDVSFTGTEEQNVALLNALRRIRGNE